MKEKTTPKRRKRIFWGIYLLITVAAVVFDVLNKNFGWLPDIFEWWKIVLGLLLIYFAIETAFARLVWMLPLFAGGLFLLLQSNIAAAIGMPEGALLAPVWAVILVAILLAIAFGLLFPMKKKKKTSRVRVHTGPNEFEQVYVKEEETASNNFGAKTVYIDCSEFTSKSISNSFGACEVRFVNVDMFSGYGELEIDNNMGAINVRVPDDWKIVNEMRSSFGPTNSVEGGAEGKVLVIKGSNSMGAVNVERESDDREDEDEDNDAGEDGDTTVIG